MKKTFKTFALMLLTALAFSSCVDVPAPYNVPGKNGSSSETIGPKGDGTLASPYNVAAIVALISEMEAGVESTTEYYIKGKVSKVKTDASTISQYGNHTFEMIDEGNSSVIFTAFQVYGPNKQKFTSVDDIKVGDEVVVCGKVVNYKGNTPETVGKGAAYVVSINASGEGSGTGEDEIISVSCVMAAQIAARLPDNTASEETYALTGYITQILGAVSTKTGSPQQSFWMADKMEDGDVFQAYYANLPEGVSEFVVGMKVKIIGKLFNFTKQGGGGAAEMKNPTVVILDNGDGGGGDTPPVGDIQHITIAEFLAKADASTTYELTGTVQNIKNTTYGNFDLVEGDASIYIYGLLDLDGNKQKFSTLGIEEGDKVTLTGKYKLYNNNPEIENAQFVKVEKGQGGDSGDDGGDTPPGPGGDTVTDLVNGDFESWVSESEPTGWKSASPASNATLSKSTEARNGSFACKVGAPGAANKRLATQEITLEAGTYTFSYYAKSTTTSVCQTKGGYVHVNDDGTITDSYQYSKDYANINNSDWTLVSYEFTLTSTTKLCLLVMNPKNSSYSVSQDILVDDATLTKQ